MLYRPVQRKLLLYQNADQRHNIMQSHVYVMQKQNAVNVYFEKYKFTAFIFQMSE